MPQIIVTAGDAADLEKTITLRERINAADFESDRFATNLIERIAWAVSDATEAEQRAPTPETAPAPETAHGSETAHAPRELIEA